MLEYILVILPALIFYLYFKTTSPLDAIPGPNPSFLVGNALQLASGQPHLNLRKFAKKYGGLFKLRLFTLPVVVVSDSELLYTMLVKNSSDFAGRPLTYRYRLFNSNQSAIGFTDAGPVLKARRKVVSTFIKQFGSGVKKIEEITQIAARDMITRLVKQDGHPVDVRETLVHCTADVTLIFLTGETIDIDDIKTILGSIDGAVGALTTGSSGILLDTFPQLRFFGNTCYKTLMNYISMRNLYANHWINMNSSHGFINHLMSLSEEKLKNGFLDEHKSKLATIWEFLTAGIITSSTTLTHLVNVLCHHPEIQKKLQKEILDVVGSARDPCIEDRDNMPYMRATILEIGRYASIVPLAAPHKTTKDTTLGGFDIPKGTEVWPNLWELHHAEDLWEEPYNFKPERFLDENGDVVPPDHPNRKNLMPFGAGNRVCVGEIFALTRMFLIMAHILQNFSILPETRLEDQPSCDPRDMTYGGIVLLPPPFKVKLMPLNG